MVWLVYVCFVDARVCEKEIVLREPRGCRWVAAHGVGDQSMYRNVRSIPTGVVFPPPPLPFRPGIGSWVSPRGNRAFAQQKNPSPRYFNFSPGVTNFPERGGLFLAFFSQLFRDCKTSDGPLEAAQDCLVHSAISVCVDDQLFVLLISPGNVPGRYFNSPPGGAKASFVSTSSGQRVHRWR